MQAMLTSIVRMAISVMSPIAQLTLAVSLPVLPLWICLGILRYVDSCPDDYTILHLTFVSCLQDDWFMPTTDLVNIYTEMNSTGQGPLVEPEWINACAIIFYAGLSPSHGLFSSDLSKGVSVSLASVTSSTLSSPPLSAAFFGIIISIFLSEELMTMRPGQASCGTVLLIG
jgi:hypothetical protein